jgi:hypothetical protein
MIRNQGKLMGHHESSLICQEILPQDTTKPLMVPNGFGSIPERYGNVPCMYTGLLRRKVLINDD